MNETPALPSLGVSPQLWQLISPTLPVGAYAYSDGLEYAVTAGWLQNETDVRRWVLDLARYTLGELEVPVLGRLYAAWQRADHSDLEYWNAFLLSARETREILEADRQMGKSLGRLIVSLGTNDDQLDSMLSQVGLSFITPYTLACNTWRIPLEEAAGGYVWSWAEARVGAAVKLIPLGQTAGQRILFQVSRAIGAIVERGLAVKDEEIGASAPGLALASTRHEEQHTRLFRS